MGACWARCCFVGKQSRKYHSQRTYYFQRDNTVEFGDFVDELESPTHSFQDEEAQQSGLGSISSYLPFRRFRWTKLKESLQMDSVQRVPEPMESAPSELTRTQPLDALNLMRWEGVRAASQTPHGSLEDLEWENEEMALTFSMVPSASEADLLKSRVLPRPICSMGPSSSVADSRSNTVRSQGSSSNSLEWDTEDILQDHISSNLVRSEADAETENLIHEIESLTRKALMETGHAWHR